MIYYIFIVIFPFFSFVRIKIYKNFGAVDTGFFVSFCSLRWQTGTDWLYYDDFMSRGIDMTLIEDMYYTSN